MRKRFVILGLVCLTLTFFAIKGTYSLFETNPSGNADFQIAKWVIKLNDRDISQDKLITLDDFNIINSSHTEEGYFAPGSIAEYELDIDVAESDVSVQYEIDIDDSSLESYPNIHIKTYDLDTEEEITSNHRDGIITLDDPIKLIRIKIILEWENLEEYDITDTELIDGRLNFNIKVNFKQYLEG